MTRTLQSLLKDARDALAHAGLTELEWTLAEVVSAERPGKGELVVGDLGWGSERVRYACVDRSVPYRLAQHGAELEPGLRAAFDVRLVIHRRFGFQAEIHDVDVATISCHEKGRV